MNGTPKGKRNYVDFLQGKEKEQYLKYKDNPRATLKSRTMVPNHFFKVARNSPQSKVSTDRS